MTGPPAARRPRDYRLCPANGIPLPHDRYDVRAGDGLLICRVSREAAEAQILAGTVEFHQGPSGAYLRPTIAGAP
jgi:hypothetical protein